MSNIKINERILEAIKENSKDDRIIERFLIDLIYEEADHPGTWWWKEIYKRKVNKLFSKWEGDDEN